MQHFIKIANSYKPLNIVAMLSILDVCEGRIYRRKAKKFIADVPLGSKYASVTHFLSFFENDLFRAVMVKVTFMFGPLETVV